MITKSAPDVTLRETPCHRCGILDRHRVERGTGPHGLKLACAHCGAFIRWLPTRTPEEREAGRQAGIRAWMSTQPPSPKQVQHLKRMAYKGAKPANKLEAHDTIDAMRKARGWA